MQHNQRTSYFRLITVLLAAALVVGCGRGFIPDPATALPDDVTELFELSGNLDSDTVWVFAQGGPLHMLDPYTSEYFSNYRSYEDVQFAHAHQTLTLNHDLAAHYEEFSPRGAAGRGGRERGDPAPDDRTLPGSGQARRRHRTLLWCVPHGPLSVGSWPKCRRPVSDHGRPAGHARGRGHRIPDGNALLVPGRRDAGAVSSGAGCRSPTSSSWRCASPAPRDTTATRNGSPTRICKRSSTCMERWTKPSAV